MILFRHAQIYKRHGPKAVFRRCFGKKRPHCGSWAKFGGEFAVKDDALTSAAPASFYTLEQGQVFARDAERAAGQPAHRDRSDF